MEVFERESATKLDGRCRQFLRQWSLPNEGRRLRGTVYFEVPVEVDAQAHVQGEERPAIHSAILHIKELTPPEQEQLPEHQEEAIVFGYKDGCIFFVEEKYDILNGELSLCLPTDQFEILWQNCIGDADIRFDGRMLGVNYSNPLRLVDGSTTKLVKGVCFTFLEGTASSYAWFNARITEELQSTWRKEHFQDYSQVARIFKEFAASAASLPTEERMRATSPIVEIVRDARSAMRIRPQNANKDFDWYSSRSYFSESLKDLAPSEIVEFETQYDSLWRHCSMNAVLTSGEFKAGAQANNHQAPVDELESIAARLLENPANSPTLEWVLLDALVYAECVAFAQHLIAGTTLFGIPYVVPIESPKPWKLFGKGLVGWAWSVVKEGGKVFATYFIALVLAQENVQTAWVITTGVTAARWMRSAILWRELRPKQKHAELLEKMCSLANSFRRQDFNAQAARDELRNVTNAGAVFSPWVASILDARIRRQAQG